MRRRTWTLLLATALGLPLAFLGLAPLAAAHFEREASTSWRLAGRPLEDLPARYPRSSANESARRIAELAAPLGIEFSRPGFSSPGLRPLHEHVQARLAGRAGATPEPLQRYRIEHAGAIEALVRQLATDGVPRFELDVSNVCGTIPNLRAVRELGNLLALEALERPEDGQRALVALWNLSTGLRERPEAISVLMAAQLDRQALSIARRLDSVPAELASRLDEVDYGEALQSDMQTMTCAHRLYAEEGGVHGTERPRLSAGLSGPFERRLLRLRAADTSRVMAQVAVALREHSRCEPLDMRGLPRFAYWNRGGQPGPLGQIWSTLLSAQLDVELTRKVLSLRAQRGPDGAWPAALADAGSQVCPGASWRYTRHPDGGVGLAWGGSEPQRELATLTFEAGLR